MFVEDFAFGYETVLANDFHLYGTHIYHQRCCPVVRFVTLDLVQDPGSMHSCVVDVLYPLVRHVALHYFILPKKIA